MAVSSNNKPGNYRQEIRGVMRDPSTALATNITEPPPTSLHGQSHHPLPKIPATSSTTETERQQLQNRLSRVHPQLQQHHFKNLWKHYLYELQQKAPTPKRVICRYQIASRPAHYGREFHGIMGREEAETILLEEGGDDGRYLVRESSRTSGQMTLSLRFNGQTKNFRLYFRPSTGKHYVNDAKEFDTVHDLVADGIITLYVELHGAEYIANLSEQCKYEESPYMTLHKGRLTSRIKFGARHNAAHSGPSQRQLQVQAAVAHACTQAATAQQIQLQQKQSLQQQQQPPQQLSSSRHPSSPLPPPPIPPSTGRHSIIVPNTSGGNSKASNRRSMPSGAGGGGIRPFSIHDDEAPPEGGSDLCDEGIINIQAFEKAHAFRTHTFIGNPWCDFCGNFIWGLIGQGVRCDDCGFGAHRKCSELVPADCCPDLQHIRRIFGIDLTTFVKASNNLRPFVVDQCIAEIERRGLWVEGLYRACGSNDDIEMLKTKFESDWENTEMYLRSIEDIHTITGLLKMYLRLLPIPLITFEAYEHFVEAAKKRGVENVIDALKEASSRLPAAHYQTLKYLISHLDRVSAHESHNLMSAKNLSLIFGQTILYTPNIPMMFQMNCWEVEAKTIELLIVHHTRIFPK